jgi:hypothetical protein
MFGLKFLLFYGNPKWKTELMNNFGNSELKVNDARNIEII